jgi:cell wall assembly regulator SMI1
MTFTEYVTALKEIYQSEQVELRLCPAGTEEDVQALESAFGVQITPALSSMWLRANGSETPAFARPGYFTGYRLMTTTEASDERSVLEKRAATYGDYVQPGERDQRIRSGWFQPGWVPFAEFGGGSLLLLEDHSPSDEGASGQIIGFVHDPDEIVYVAASMEDYLASSLENIAADPYEYGISSDHWRT